MHIIISLKPSMVTGCTNNDKVCRPVLFIGRVSKLKTMLIPGNYYHSMMTEGCI